MANTGAGVDMYFHCFAKVCTIANEATCSTSTVTGTAITSCAATPVAAPTRRRRDDHAANDETGPEKLDAAVIKVTVKNFLAKK